MDINKILAYAKNAKNNSASIDQGSLGLYPQSPEHEEEVLDLLYLQLKKDVVALSKHPETLKDSKLSYLSSLKIWQGKLDLNLKTRSYKPYVFIDMSKEGKPGLLIELVIEEKKLTVRQATMVVPLLTQNGESRIPEIFVTKSPIKEEYDFLGGDILRSRQGETLCVEQLSEALILMAIS
jgi:hypothetical protein